MKRLFLALALLMSCTLGTNVSASAPIPVGVNYSHVQRPNCEYTFEWGILGSYDQPGIREVAQEQLAAMRASGMTALRLPIWHRPAGTYYLGGIPSGDGVVTEPYRSNMIAFMQDIVAAGFNNLDVAFAPVESASPSRETSYYNPAMFEANWNFMQDVHGIITEYGPPNVFWDLLLEGAPQDYLPPDVRAQLTDYLIRMWRNWVGLYGSQNATIGFISMAPNTVPELIGVFQQAGVGYPGRWNVSLYPNPSASVLGAYNDLHNIDVTLAAAGLNQPLAVVETYYNDASMARGIQKYMKSTTRPLAEVIEWPIVDNLNNTTDCPQPPYSASHYLSLATILSEGIVNTQLTSAGVSKCCAPWRAWVTIGGGIRQYQKARLMDSDGMWWADVPIVISPDANSFTFTFPKNVPPSGCNLGTACTIGLYAVDSVGTLSNKLNLVLPASP